ncbi:MAG: hypothetical protein II684_07945 [Treponema sp.]|nr:hypothetical protein [Treponema sp.]MBR4464613.1 hypothetical protein [Treponema sp.]
MKSVCVCKECGRTIEREFIYCPWCGMSRIGVADNQEVLDSVFSRLEEKQADDREKRLRRLESQLDELEKDLNVLVLSAEMHK